MFTLPIGILSVFLVTYFSLSGQSSSIYLNQHSFIIVCLGTVALSFFSIPKKDFLLTIRSIKDLFRKDSNKNTLKDILLSLSKTKKTSENVEHIPLVNYAVKLWEQGVDKDSFDYLVNEKFEDLNKISEQPIVVLKNLAKYPPALGMTGTVMGMISLFANLNTDNKSEIGLSLAMAMTATFYGLILANMIILPLADRIHVKHQSVMNRNEAILNALLQINNSEPHHLIESINIDQDFYEQAG